MTEQRKRQGWLWVFVAIPVLVVAYPLSIGPAIWLADRGYLSEPLIRMLARFYWPLVNLSEQYPPFERVFTAYMEMF